VRFYFDRDEDKFCESVSFDFTLKKTEYNEVMIPSFLIANTGRCSLFTKAKNIEKTGAAIAILIDEVD
jgi:hypothetical protein